MSAYASAPGQSKALPANFDADRVGAASAERIMESLIAQLADRVAAAVLARLDGPADASGNWLDLRHAADYLGVHRDTLRKLAAERAIPSEQDGPGCKLYFRSSDLDAWRAGGGRSCHLSAVTELAA